MDSSIKACINIFFAFMAMIMLVCVASFFIKYNQLTTTLYSIIQNIEMSDRRTFGDDLIPEGVVVEVTPVKCTYGQQYNVQLYFDHLFGFVNSKRRFSICGLTRMFEY